MVSRSVASASAVSGPVARIVRPSVGTAFISSQTTVTLGWPCSRSVTARPKSSRSTARAPPAGTRLFSASSRISEPARRISSLMSPTALARALPRREFEHTSSAKKSCCCAGVLARGFCSTSRTCTPRSASCQAHSLPASPAPTTVTVSLMGEA